MLSLSLNFLFLCKDESGCMGATWPPPSSATCWLTVESTKGSYVDPPPIWWCTLTPLPFDSLTKSKSPNPMARTPSQGQQLTRPLGPWWFRFGPTQVGPKDLFLFKPPVLFSSAQIWAFSCLAHFLLFLLFIVLFYFIYINIKYIQSNFMAFKQKTIFYFIYLLSKL